MNPKTLFIMASLRSPLQSKTMQFSSRLREIVKTIAVIKHSKRSDISTPNLFKQEELKLVDMLLNLGIRIGFQQGKWVGASEIICCWRSLL